MKLKNITLVVLCAIIVTAIIIILFGSGVLATTEGMIYFLLIIFCLAILSFPFFKSWKEKKENKRLMDIVQDPEKLFNELTKDKAGNDRTIIDNGHKVDIRLKEDPKTGQKELVIKEGEKVNQEWRKQYETTPLEKKEEKPKTKTKSKPVKGARKKPFPKPIMEPVKEEKKAPRAPKPKNQKV